MQLKNTFPQVPLNRITSEHIATILSPVQAFRLEQFEFFSRHQREYAQLKTTSERDADEYADDDFESLDFNDSNKLLIMIYFSYFDY